MKEIIHKHIPMFKRPDHNQPFGNKGKYLIFCSCSFTALGNDYDDASWLWANHLALELERNAA